MTDSQQWSRRGWLEATSLGPLLAMLGCSPPRNGAPPMSDAPTPSPAPPPSPTSGALTMVDDDVDAYATRHTVAESEVMRAIAEETRATTEWWIMMIGPIEAALLRTLVRLRSARRIVEVGTFTGYSAIAMAEGMPDDGKLFTLDIDENWTGIAKKHWAKSPHGRKIVLKLGRAAETLKMLDGPFDLAFIDADKVSYPEYWDLIVPKMAPGGLVVCDNVLFGGRVVAPDDDSAQRMAAFNTKVRNDPRVETLMLPLRDGVSIAQVLAK
jgi:caffeoyl-CoA O-methyltransferase